MEDKTDWYLKSKEGFCNCPKARCLRFYSCPNPSCQTIVLQCTKTGMVYPNPKDPRQVEIATFTCPQCDSGPIDAFGGVHLEDLRKLGFKKEELC